MEAFCSALYALRVENRALTIGDDEFEKEREVLREQKLVLRQDADALLRKLTREAPPIQRTGRWVRYFSNP